MVAARLRTAATQGSGSATRLVWPIAGLLMAGLLAGCAKDDITRLQARRTTYLEGVPVPAGFELANKMTEDYESGGQRNARHEYRGFADPQAVRNFYRDQMPAIGWSRVSDQNVKGIISQRFERRNEACTVQIERGWYLQTTIQIIVNPFSRSEAPRRPVP